jgi:hypothetical protein
MVKKTIWRRKRARVRCMSYRRFNSCRFWIRSNENRNASKSGWTFVGLWTKKKRRCQSRISFPIQMTHLWFIRDVHMTTHICRSSCFERSSCVLAWRIKKSWSRYCPSIEDKINRFADKERHHYLWPEGWNTCECICMVFLLPRNIKFEFCFAVWELNSFVQVICLKY